MSSFGYTLGKIVERNYLRLRTALLTLSLSISLIACGGGGSEESASAPKEVPDNSSPVHLCHLQPIGLIRH